MPKAERKRPIVEEGRPRPPLKEKREVAGVLEHGLERKTGKTCMKAALWRGRRAKETSMLRTSWVQVDLGAIVLGGGPFWIGGGTEGEEKPRSDKSSCSSDWTAM